MSVIGFILWMRLLDLGVYVFLLVMNYMLEVLGFFGRGGRDLVINGCILSVYLLSIVMLYLNGWEFYSFVFVIWKSLKKVVFIICVFFIVKLISG